MAAFLTQATIWIAMLAWTIAILRSGRLWWTIGLASYLFHILAAFESHYHWSHEIALSETAHQTAEVTGWKSGVGLYFNFAFFAILAVDLIVLYLRGRRPFPKSVEGLVFFMILNGAVVFGDGAVRIYGAALFVGIVVVWIQHWKTTESRR